METAYDTNAENNVCEIETSHFKTYDTNHEYTNPKVVKDSFLEDENKVANPMDLLKSNTNADFKIDQTTSDLLETKHRFDDDFGPETDVDAVDDANVAKTPNMLQEDHAFSSEVSNGVKPFSLENKIIEHLSGQHKEFLSNTNPFNDDQFDEYNGQQQSVKDELMDETGTAKCEIDSELVVDNKIIDALETLGITNGEKQTHDDEDKPLDSGLVNDSSSEAAGYTEKVDNSHEKYYTKMQNEDPFDNNSPITCDKQPVEEQAYGINPNCAATSAGEESDEEEDEWNYIQGDKKQDQQPAEQSEPEPAPSVGEPVEVEAAADHHHEDPVPALGSEPAVGKETEVQQQPLDEPLEELADPTLSDTDAFATVVGEPSETIIDDGESREVDAAVELDGEEEEALIEPVPAVASPVIPSEEEYKQYEEEEQQEQEVQETEQHESADYAPSPVPRSDLKQPEDIPEEPISQPDLVSLEQAQSLDKDTTEEELSNLQEESAQPEELLIATVAAADEEAERPNSLSFDMASKLNPEAKEFVPTGSPTQSNPTSPVASMPEMPQNSFLLLGDDVVAQSPKKGIATMDNIDVPAEDDFQNEMNNCPHELEQFPEHTNGTANGDETIGSHSPVSEPSYQELNLKEAMQCDEKLDNEYSDVQQNNDTTDNHHPIELNLLAKEQNPMSMSFYEGRDDALIISNSDELNKVQPLPSDDELSELANGQSVEETVATNEEDAHSVEDETPIQHEEKHLVSFGDPVVVVNEDKPSHVEQLPESIFSVASQVVDDVSALVDQMQIETPSASQQQEEIAKPFELDEQFSKPPVETELLSNENESENLVSFELDTGFEKHVKEEVAVDEIVADNLDVEQAVLQQEVAEFSQPLSSAETDEMASPVVEVSQLEITADNEFITDENVLDVIPSPVPAGHEAPISPVPIAVQHDKPVEEELCVVKNEVAVEQIPEITPTVALMEEPATTELVPTIEEVKTTVGEAPAQETTTASEEVIDPKPKTPEPVVSSVGKTVKAPATVGAIKKAQAVAKPSTTKPAAKQIAAAKTTTVPAAKKTPATTGPTAAARTSTIGAAKSPKVAATTRTSTVGTADRKPAATSEKKLVNGDAKPTPIQKRTVTSTAASATAKTTSTTPTTTAARPSSVGAKSLTAAKPPATRPAAPARAPASAKAPTMARAPVSAAPRPTTGPAKTGSATTARTSAGLPATKPRVAPTTAGKPTGATTASKITVSATKRISSVQTTTQKSVSSTTTVAKASATTSRTSVVSKTSSTTTASAGLVRKTGTAGAAPARKPISSPSAAKTGTRTVAAPAAGGKPAPIRKIVAAKEVKEATLSNNETTQDLLDLDKQLKNDNNQLITKNGLETHMIVIDSAAD